MGNLMAVFLSSETAIYVFTHFHKTAPQLFIQNHIALNMILKL